MTKGELVKMLENVDDNELVLVNVKNLYEGEAQWHDIDVVDTNSPVTLLINGDPCMY